MTENYKSKGDKYVIENQTFQTIFDHCACLRHHSDWIVGYAYDTTSVVLQKLQLGLDVTCSTVGNRMQACLCTTP